MVLDEPNNVDKLTLKYNNVTGILVYVYYTTSLLV